jgi:insulysin
MADPDSLLPRFWIGGLSSLQKEGTRDVLLDFHKEWYSSNIMKLTLYSNRSINQLESLVYKYFYDIENKNVEIPDYGKVPNFHEGNMGKLYKMVPIKEVDEIMFMYALPHYEFEYYSQPLNYFSHIFGHEGENSLCSYLKNLGLAKVVSSYSYS